MKYVRDSLKINNYWSLNAHFQIKSWAWTIAPEAYSQPCETSKMERFASVNCKLKMMILSNHSKIDAIIQKQKQKKNKKKNL